MPDLHADPVPLHPDLAACMTDSAVGDFIKHPLLYATYHPMFAEMLNDGYEHKRKALAEALEAHDWRRVVFLHEKPYRTFALAVYVLGCIRSEFLMPLAEYDPEVQRLAAEVWRDSENLHENTDDWRVLLSGYPTADGTIFTDTTPEAWAALPDTLTVYRGECNDGGFSWSLEEKVARFFANRFDAGLDLTVGRVAKADVAGYLTGRNEDEVLILDPSAVEVIEVRRREV